MGGGLAIMDDDGGEVVLDEYEAAGLMAVTGRLEAATVSACPDCCSRVVATVAFVELMDASAPHERHGDLVELADDAPTLHLYVVDLATDCEHLRWRDPLADEWCDVVEVSGPRGIRR
jgi:hypothetical protein